ncbi:hypothetical protein [Nonomuraea zeae]|uniref:Cell wall-active antibiotics response LiaF-like C-terminal domain-containing protein n=1 Tax=Nonomuraea zeae TaxID=1642303 RepID=A0A5S4GW52_9ACTN|nr:hypothetical protein [Nonomuraea zeae]TMR37186.1 hypothetical protein ETD85_08640 [Nonomuraea zeae]
MTNTTSPQQTDWHLSLIGGLKQRAGRLSGSTVVLTPVGGAHLDLADAELAPESTLTKVSLIGGVMLRVPAEADVRVEGFHLFGGRRVEAGSPSATGPVIRVRAYGLIGGVTVTRS